MRWLLALTFCCQIAPARAAGLTKDEMSGFVSVVVANRLCPLTADKELLLAFMAIAPANDSSFHRRFQAEIAKTEAVYRKMEPWMRESWCRYMDGRAETAGLKK